MGGQQAKLLPQSQRVVPEHLIAGKQAEKFAAKLRQEFKDAEKGPVVNGKYPSLSNKEEGPGILANMHAVMDTHRITVSVDKSAMPAWAFNPNASRKQAGKYVAPRDLTPIYGLSEDELKGIFAMRRDQPEAATVSHMASLYKIKDSEVKSILKYLSPVIPLPDPANPKIGYARREFDSSPDR